MILYLLFENIISSRRIFMSENTVSKSKFKTTDIVYIAMLVAVMAVCARISLLIGTVPVTMQTFAVFIAVYLLGGKRGTISVLVYILLGAVGLPIFAMSADGTAGGLGKLTGATGGYIIGFLFSALVMWACEKILGKKLWAYAVSMVLGLIVCYAFGTAWFMVVYARNNNAMQLMSVLSLCVFPFIIPDLVKIALALFIGSNKGIRQVIKVD
jgi:biotin transport system substrate-specific component